MKLGDSRGEKAVLVNALDPRIPPAPTFKLEPSVPAKVKLLPAVRVLPSAIVRVDPVAGAVIDTLFIVVAAATPRTGVVKVGLVANTAIPDPVSSDNAPNKPAELVNTSCLPATDAVAAAVTKAVVATAVVLLPAV